MRAVFGSAILVTLLALTHLARADDNTAAADEAFREGNALALTKKYKDACPKLAESQRLDPAVGTEFNLADCYEHLGRTATAYALFIDVQKIAHTAGKFERERLAKGRAEALAPRLPHVQLDVQASAPGLEVKLDEASVAVTSEPIPTDPGTHTILASAPSRTTWSGTVTTTEGVTATVVIPELVDPNPPPVVVVPDKTPAAPPERHTQKTIAYVAGGIGIAGIAVGAITGAMALSKKSDANRLCPSDTDHFRCPTQAGSDAWNSAQAVGNVSTVGFIVGGVALAAAIVLWVTAPSSKKPVTTAWTF